MLPVKICTEVAGAVPVALLHQLVDLCRDPANRFAIAIGQEEGGAGMLEIGIVGGLEMECAFQQQRRDPIGVVTVNAEGQVMEGTPLRFCLYRDDFHRRAHRAVIPLKKRGTIASAVPI